MSWKQTALRVFCLVFFVFVLIWSSSQSSNAAASSLFISEYVEGSSNNKAIEIYNGTGLDIDLTAGGYSLEYYFNGNTSPLTTINLSGTLVDGDVYIVVDNDANATLLGLADLISNSSFFNGDDAIVLRNSGGIIDVIGQIGTDPGSQWGSGLVSTQNNTLRRQADVCGGDANGSDTFIPTDEWDGFAQDTFDGLGSHVANCGGTGDNPPTVNSTTPTDGQPNVTIDSNLGINFSEAVTVTGSWFDISCTTSGNHAATVTGGPQSFSLDPTTDFAGGESCTVTIVAAQVTDQDGTPDNMTADYQFSFNTSLGGFGACGDLATLIHAVQGNGALSPLNGVSNVTVEGVVVGDYQNATSELGGFFLQEEDGDVDGDSATSEGLFVYDAGLGPDVALGDVIRVEGSITEFETSTGSGTFLTEMNNVTNLTVCSSGSSVTPATLSLPLTALTDLEPFEGMLVNLPQTLTVTETYDLARYGSVELSAGRLFNPTQITTPGAAANAQQAQNDLSRLILDDANGQQNKDPVIYPDPGLAAGNSLRNGSTVTGLTAVLDQRFTAYRLQPVGTVNFVDSNPRTASPAAVGGSLQVASFNVLNYFNGNGTGGGFPTSRGADTLSEFNRQRDKIISALVALNADVYGLIEIENDGYGANSAIQDLVNGLNAATAPNTFAFVNPGVSTIGTDEIAVGLIYRVAAVTPTGAAAILDSSVNPLFLDTKNRPVLAQTFAQISNGESFTIAVNHFKSKGSACTDVGDPDLGDGQGNCNQTRADAATALVSWLASDPTNSLDNDFLIVGDLNAYGMEDPIQLITNAGFVDLTNSLANSYSYVFQGQFGTLDYAMASPTLNSQVSGSTIWHINSDEPRALDYNEEFQTAGQIALFYDSDAYRASDHDPILVGLNLGGSTTPTPTATNTPLPTATNTPLPTATNTPLPTATNTPLPTATNTPLPTATNTPLPTATNTPLPTATNTPLPTATNTPLPTATNTPLPTATNTPLPTATNTPIPTATNTPLPTATSTPLPADYFIYMSTISNGNVGGLSFADEDIVVYDVISGLWSLYFDGSDVGLSGSGARDIDSFHILADGSILMSISAASTLPDVGAVDDSDIVRFIPTSLGTATAGTFELYFDGSDVGLTTNGEDVDAIYVAANGDLLLSTTGGVSVPGASGSDEDLLRFTPTSLGANTAGSWIQEFDGSDVELGGIRQRDLSGVWLDELNNTLEITLRGTFAVTGAAGDGSDVLSCGSLVTGNNTSCSYSLLWDSSAAGLLGEITDGLHIERP